MKNKPGMMARLATVLGDHDIDIDSLMQKEAPEDAAYVPVIVVTGPAAERSMRDALETVAGIDGLIDQAPVLYRIEDFK